MYRCRNVHEFTWIDVQMEKCTRGEVETCTDGRVYRCTGTRARKVGRLACSLMDGCTGVHVDRCTRGQVCTCAYGKVYIWKGGHVYT